MRSLAVLAAAGALHAIVTHAPPARACGGCFIPVDTTATVVTAHRMAMSISPSRSVLWDQIRYAGDPDDFAWVLPVKPGGYVEVGSDAWFETLEAATATRINPPPMHCEPAYSAGCGSAAVAGCSSDGDGRLGGGAHPGDDDVVVTHEGTVGPYETVTVHAADPSALTAWLKANGYNLPPDIEPVVAAYVEEGFDFLALRLAPEFGVQQMRPVRVIQPGAVTSLPLRMVAAGTGPFVAVTLFVIAEGRYQAKNFGKVGVNSDFVTWDFADSSSNYAELREEALTAHGGRSFLTAFAKPRALLSPVENPLTGLPVRYRVEQDFFPTLAEALVARGIENGEASDTSCVSGLRAAADRADLVVDPCDPQSGACGAVGAGEIDARELACGGVDDLAVALTGLHPKDVWVTRLEANLPRLELVGDLLLEPADPQVQRENWLAAGEALNDPCSENSVAYAPRGARGGPRPPAPPVVALALLVLGLGRRLLRGRLAVPSRAPS